VTTAYCFDPEHTYHREDGHPEHPRRLDAVMAHLAASGRLDRMREVPAERVPMEAILRVHAEDYPTMLEAACVRGGGRFDEDTYGTEVSFRVARRAAGGLLALTDAVLAGEADNAFALVRPPGHHARPATPMGFCLLGNVAIAARHAQAVHGAERVLIVDFDVHHGNGTQEMFYDDLSVLVVTSQQATAWPGTGRITETGEGAGAGFTVNVPLPNRADDAGVADLYRRLLPPVAARFRPDLVLVSAGFDAHHRDPLADLALSAAGFAEIMRVLLEVADAYCGRRLVAALEGGYHPEALAASVAACLAVMEDPTAEVEDPFGTAEPGPDLTSLWDDLRTLHRL
jgi:acetoin utilization deacetylase AcuC-like enzyme